MNTSKLFLINIYLELQQNDILWLCQTLFSIRFVDANWWLQYPLKSWFNSILYVSMFFIRRSSFLFKLFRTFFSKKALFQMSNKSLLRKKNRLMAESQLIVIGLRWNRVTLINVTTHIPISFLTIPKIILISDDKKLFPLHCRSYYYGEDVGIQSCTLSPFSTTWVSMTL